MKWAFVVLSAVATAWAQMTVNTPTGAISCLNQQVSWTGGTGPYTLQVIPGDDTTAAALNTYGNIAASPYIWLVEQAANTRVFLRLRDSTGLTAESGIVTIQAGGPATCSPSTASSSGTTPPGTTGATTPPAETSNPPATTPAPGTTPTTGGSSSNTSRSTTPSASSTGSSGGALGSAKVAGGVVGLVGLVAAVLA